MWMKSFFAFTRNQVVGRTYALLASVLLLVVVLLAAGDAPRAETAMERLQRKLGQSAAGAGNTSSQWPLLVPAAEFSSVGGGTGLYFFERDLGVIRPYDDPLSPGLKAVCMRAPVYLPDGTRVHGISAYVYDDDPDANISRIELRRAPYRSTAGTLLMASTNTAGQDIPVIQKRDAPVTAGALVDNSQYSYLALVCMEGTGTSSTLRLYVLAVRYSSKTYVPFIVNET